MIYSFACPFPCSYRITVHAGDYDEALHKIITAGAMGCRNRNRLCHCSQPDHDLPPMTQEELKNIVGLCMETEHVMPT